jgi:hypothetical protein
LRLFETGSTRSAASAKAQGLARAAGERHGVGHRFIGGGIAWVERNGFGCRVDGLILPGLITVTYEGLTLKEGGRLLLIKGEFESADEPMKLVAEYTQFQPLFIMFSRSDSKSPKAMPGRTVCHVSKRQELPQCRHDAHRD